MRELRSVRVQMDSRLRVSDARVWRAATWVAPFAIQVVVGIVIAISWLVGKNAPAVHGFVQYVIGAALTFVLVAAVGIVLLVRGTWRAQGVAVGIVGSYVVAIVVATTYGFWVIGW